MKYMIVLLITFFVSILSCGGHQKEEALNKNNHIEKAEHHLNEVNEKTDNAPKPIDGNINAYGKTIDESLTLTPLNELVSNPEQYQHQTIKTEGTIVAVCQKSGCWMEIQTGTINPVHVAMAGHSFYLPKNIAGRKAFVEGKIQVKKMSDEEKAHYASEGAKNIPNEVQITATAVLLQ